MMNFYYIGKREFTPLVFRYGIPAGCPVCAGEENILLSALDVYDQSDIDAGDVAAYKISIPKTEQGTAPAWPKAKYGGKYTAVFKTPCEIPPERVKAAFVICDYSKESQKDFIL